MKSKNPNLAMIVVVASLSGLATQAVAASNPNSCQVTVPKTCGPAAPGQGVPNLSNCSLGSVITITAGTDCPFQNWSTDPHYPYIIGVGEAPTTQYACNSGYWAYSANDQNQSIATCTTYPF